MIEILEELLKEKQPKLVVFDPIQSFIGINIGRSCANVSNDINLLLLGLEYIQQKGHSTLHLFVILI